MNKEVKEYYDDWYEGELAAIGNDSMESAFEAGFRHGRYDKSIMVNSFDTWLETRISTGINGRMVSRGSCWSPGQIGAMKYLWDSMFGGEG